MYIKCYIFFPLYMLPYLLPLLINPSLSPLFYFFFLFCGSSQDQMSKDWIETINWNIVGSPGVTVLKPMTSNVSWIHQWKIVQLEEWRPWAMLPTKPECWWKHSCPNSGYVKQLWVTILIFVWSRQRHPIFVLPIFQLFYSPIPFTNVSCIIEGRVYISFIVMSIYPLFTLNILYSSESSYWLLLTEKRGFFTKDDCSICLWP